MKKTSRKEKVVIMGAGFAGLSAGFELSKKGFHVEVFEMCNQIGGLAKTIEVNGFRFDTGPHRWFTKNKNLDNWILQLLGDEVIKVPRLTRIYFDKKFFYYPIRLKNALFGMGLFKSIKAVADYSLTKLVYKIKKKKIRTLEDGYIEKFGKTLYEIFFKRYSEKLWGRKCTEVSADWIGQRTRGFNISTILKETLFSSRKNVVSFVDEFRYPRCGIGRLTERLASQTKKLDGEIHTNSEVVKINHRNGKIVSIDIKREDRETRLVGDYFISSIPISDLIKRLNPSAPCEILNLGKLLQYRDELQVALFLRKCHLTPDTWIYVHPKEIPFMRVMEMDNWSSLLSPSGTTTLVFEIACNEGDSMWKKSDKKLIEMVAETYIREFNLISKKDIIGGYVHRCPKEYPVYHLGYKEDVDKIKKYLQKFSNFQIVGRNGTFRYNNMDHSIEMGLYAAWNIISGRKKYDIESVNIEREYLEEKRIENIEDETLEESYTNGRKS